MSKMKKLVSIFDRKSQIFGAPVCVNTLPEAERQFLDLASDDKTLVGKHPEDFELILVGQYDEDTGAITPCNQLVAQGEKK